MPLIAQHLMEPLGEWGLWRIEEPEDWFLAELSLAPAELQQLAAIKGRRREEWLAARLLLHRMSGRAVRGVLFKDEYGKPFLEGSAWMVSISHSQGLAAAAAAPGRVGIDIQLFVPKIERLSRRFMRPDELDSLAPETRLWQLHLYWGAKEALYKAYGRRQLDFCRDMRIDPFSFSEEGGRGRAFIRSAEGWLPFQLEYRLLDAYALVWVVESPGAQV